MSSEVSTVSPGKFDMLSLSVGRVGTIALHQYLSQHPDINAPSLFTTDKLISSANYSQLHTLVNPSHKHNLLTMHNPTDVFYESQKASHFTGTELIQDIDLNLHWNQLIKDHIDPNFLIFPVRHPFELAVSGYNRGLWNSIYNDKNDDYISESDYINIFPKYLVGFTIFKLIHKLFKDFKIIEFQQLLPINLENTLINLYSKLNLSIEQIGYISDSPSNDNTRFYFAASPIVIEPSRAVYLNLWITLGEEEIITYENNLPRTRAEFIPVASIDIGPERMEQAGLKSSIFLMYLEQRQIEQLPERLLLTTKQYLAAYVATLLLNYIQNLIDFHSRYQKKQIRELSKISKQRILSYIEKDLDYLISVEPELNSLWRFD